MDELVKYLKALVFLQLQVATGNTAFSKPEVLLAKAGFTHKEIADLLGKTQAAIAKSISRAQKGKPQGEQNE